MDGYPKVGAALIGLDDGIPLGFWEERRIVCTCVQERFSDETLLPKAGFSRFFRAMFIFDGFPKASLRSALGCTLLGLQPGGGSDAGFQGNWKAIQKSCKSEKTDFNFLMERGTKTFGWGPIVRQKSRLKLSVRNYIVKTFIALLLMIGSLSFGGCCTSRQAVHWEYRIANSITEVNQLSDEGWTLVNGTGTAAGPVEFILKRAK
jgi:hypothetical protein